MTHIRQTQFSDVCGTIDDLKRILHEENRADFSSAVLTSYVEDCIAMLERMETRLSQFARLRDEVTRVVEQMQRVEAGKQADALRAGQALLERFSQDQVPNAEEITQLSSLAEEIRDAANLAESRLRRYKQAAMTLGRLYRGIEGGRVWQQEGQDAEGAGMEAHLAAWLPRSPHREKILEWLRADRAFVISEQGEPPVVAFEDGGMIPLRDVRWSEEVANFVPASFKPDPRGPLYRPGS